MQSPQYKSWLSVWLPFGLRRIDVYYIFFYLKTFVILMAGLFALVAIGDLFQRFDGFVILSRREEQSFQDTLVTFLRYYASFVPQLVLQYMLPVCMLLAASIAITGSYSGPRGNNEYVVIRAAGIPVLRAFIPLLLPAFFVAVAFQASRDYFLPGMVRESTAILNRVRTRVSAPTSVTLITPEGVQTAAIGSFDAEGFAHNVIVELRNAQAFQRGDASRGDNDFIAYRAAKAGLDRLPDGSHQWVPLEKAEIHTYTRFARRTRPWTDPLPTKISRAMIDRQTMGDSISTWRDLGFLRAENAGALFEWHWRFSEPVACCLLILWGAGLCMGRMLRGKNAGYIQAVTFSMIAAGLFYCLRLAGRTMWESGLLTAAEGVWLPMAVAAAIALGIVFWME